MLNKYITESRNNRNFKEIYVKQHTRVAFIQTQEKYDKENKNKNSNCESHCLHCVKQYYLAGEGTNLEDEYQ